MAKENKNIPQNSAGYVPATNLNKKDAKPKKSVGQDLRSGK